MLEEVSTKWKKLALELGFKLSVIESIGSRYSDSEEDCEFMLRKWLMRQDGTVSWEVLMTALDNIGLYSIADDLENGNYMYGFGFGFVSDSMGLLHILHPVLHD